MADLPGLTGARGVLPIPHDPAERERARYKPPDEYTRHIEGACGLLPQGVPLTDELLASIAISLKRIADGREGRATAFEAGYHHAKIEAMEDSIHAVTVKHGINLPEIVVRDMVKYLRGER